MDAHDFESHQRVTPICAGHRRDLKQEEEFTLSLASLAGKLIPMRRPSRPGANNSVSATPPSGDTAA